MDKFVIKGGVPLRGEAEIKGAKNSALPLMAASILTEGELVLRNVPHLSDVITMGKVLEGLGIKVTRGKDALRINGNRILSPVAPYELVKTMRASILVLGPLLARRGKAKVSLPGGCTIGRRPVDLHLKGLEKMGAKIKVEHGYIIAEVKGKLKGEKIHLDLPSVGATENLMLAASLSEGTTRIKNASLAPEVVDLARLLRQMGAKIKGEGEDEIKIEGVKELKPVEHTIIPDRIEAGTFIVAGVITGGAIKVKKVVPEHLDTFLGKLEEMGVEIERGEDEIRVQAPSQLKPVKLKTLPYPGFPTDLQPQLTALSCLARGTSVIVETVFENRFTHVPELRRMGANIEEEGMGIVVNGVDYLSGAPVMASDIRAGGALILAGLAARGITEVLRVYHIDRGYEKIEERLSLLGAKIKRERE